MIVLNDTTQEVIFKTLGPLVEKWSGGVKLNPTSVYGIRRYTNNSWMLGHVDKAESHIISVILNVAQDVDEDWPLYIKDHRGRGRQVLLQPGEMIYYESAKLVHSRQTPLRGRFYDNVFIHYKPKGPWYGSGKYEGFNRGIHMEPIEIEAIYKWQKKMPKTDWDDAWDAYQSYRDNTRLGMSGVTLGGNDVNW